MQRQHSTSNKHCSAVRSALIALALTLVAAMPSAVQAQPNTQQPNTQQPNTQQPDTSKSAESKPPIVISGEFGSTGELYSKSSGPSYRPSSSGKFFFRPKLSLFNSVDLKANIMISNEGSSSRQEINHIDLNPKWRWIELNLGGFTKNYTSMTLEGVRIRGVGVELTPGKLSAGALAGTLKRAVATVDGNRSYKREIVGAHLGYKSKAGNAFELFALKIEDDTSSLVEVIPEPDTTFGMDSLDIDSVQAPESVTPKENIVMASAMKLALFNKRIKIQAEAGGSIHTRDLFALKFGENVLPDEIDDYITLSASTTADYALSYRIQYVQKKINVSVAQRHIRPGYVSLGLASNRSDQDFKELRSSYRDKSYTIKVSGSTNKDNLIKQKAHTTTRNVFRGSVTAKLTKTWSSSVSVSNSTQKNDASDQISSTDNRTVTVRTRQNLKLGKNLFRKFTTNYSYRTSSDKNPLRTSSGYDSHAANMKLDLRPSKLISIQPGYNITTTKRANAPGKTSSTASLGGRLRSANGKFSANSKMQLSFSGESSSTRGSLALNYEFSKSLRASASVSSRIYRTDAEIGTIQDFEEYTSRITIRQRF